MLTIPMYQIFLIFLIVMSVIAFILYQADKKKAIAHEWRIKEVTLLGFGLCGGSIGALLAMKLFRHKTKHWYFWAVNVIGLFWQVGLLLFLASR